MRSPICGHLSSWSVRVFLQCPRRVLQSHDGSHRTQLLRFETTTPFKVVYCHITFRIDRVRFAGISTDNTPVGITRVKIVDGVLPMTSGTPVEAWPAAVQP